MFQSRCNPNQVFCDAGLVSFFICEAPVRRRGRMYDRCFCIAQVCGERQKLCAIDKTPGTLAIAAHAKGKHPPESPLLVGGECMPGVIFQPCVEDLFYLRLLLLPSL